MKVTRAHLRWLSRHARRVENGSWVCIRTGEKMSIHEVRRSVISGKVEKMSLAYFFCSCKKAAVSFKGSTVFAYQLEEVS